MNERGRVWLAGALMLLMLGCARVQPQARQMSFSFKATMRSGARVAFTLTLDPAAADRGAIREVRWKKGKDPASDKPDYDETTDLYALRAAEDGALVTCKADVPLKKPTVTFTIAGGGPGRDPGVRHAPPTVTERIVGSPFGVRDGVTVYAITERDRRALLEFIRRAGFPAPEAPGGEGA